MRNTRSKSKTVSPPSSTNVSESGKATLTDQPSQSDCSTWATDASAVASERMSSLRVSESFDGEENTSPPVQIDTSEVVFSEKKGNEENKLPQQRSVNFDTIRIREFARTLGDNPSTTHGPPLTLDWHYQDTKPIKVDEYEETRPPRRVTQEMMIPGNIRENILLSQTETTKKQIARMISQVRSSRHQRQTSVAMQDLEEWHEAFEFIARRFRRFRKGITKEREQELLWEKAQKIQQEKEEKQRLGKHSQEDAISDDTIDDECVGSAE
jgi:hypothetical protein